MSNSYFKFKQFTIHQGDCAMKVCTDACLFGAWVAEELKNDAITNILDIGAGSGLLSLMIAQKSPAKIDTVEIDEAASLQASSNIQNSKWPDRVTMYHKSIQDFKPGKKYDFIISNPPFYQNDLKSENAQRNLALHSHQLRLQELIFSIKHLLTEDGKFALLLPFSRTLEFIQRALANGFYVEKKVSVRQTEKHSFFRSILLFSSNNIPEDETEITIKTGNNYTPKFCALLKDYYLYL